MLVLSILRRVRRVGILSLIVALLAAAVLVVQPVAAQSPEDGCDPGEPVACLPLPDEGASQESPSIATPRSPLPPAPAPPPPCPQPLTRPDARIAAPLPPAPACGRRDVVVTVNRANVLYARALRSLNTRDLPLAWGGEALQQIRGYVATLRWSGHYATPELRSISLEELRVDGRQAHVRTLENWLYQERDRFTGRVVFEENQWVVNLYDLEWQGRGWLVMRNEVFATPAPFPLWPLPRIGFGADGHSRHGSQAVTAKD